MYLEEVRVSGRGGAIRTLVFWFKVKVDRAKTLVRWAKSEVKFKDERIVHPFPIFEGPQYFEEEKQQGFSVEVPVTNEALHYIEENRQGDLSLDVEVAYAQVQVESRAVLSLDSAFPSGSGYNTMNHRLNVPRSQWVRELTNLKWSEVEIFEVDSKVLKKDKYLRTSVASLREAEEHFREGDYVETLTCCAAAIHSLSSFEISGTQQKGLDALLFSCFRDETKRDAFKSLVESIEKGCQLGGDEDRYPQEPFSRVEARTQLKLTLALFELLGDQLARKGIKVKD